jgi:hypothetical protein
MKARAHMMRGVISSSGFASGDRVVVGHWWQSPIGAFTDLMWATPDGVRVLYAPDHRVAWFVTGVYAFDEIVVEPFALDGPGASRRSLRRLQVTVADRQLAFESGRALPVFVERPPWFTQVVERPIARRVMGVVPAGRSPAGVDEWYQARRVARLVRATASIGGVELGPRAPVDPPVGVGFSEPPTWPSWVELRTVLADPTGRLDDLVADLGR